MIKDVLLIAHNSLHPALRRALVARGLTLRESRRWQDTDRSQPERILGAYTWFYESLRHPLTIWSMHRFLRRQGIPLFVWNQDAPHYLNRTAWRLNWLNWARLYDLYATHTLIDSKRQFADSMLYLANAADISRYHLRGATLAELRDPKHYEYDVSFFGAMDGNRYKEDRARQAFFATLADRLKSKGITFQFIDTVNRNLSLKEQVAVIQSSRINLNFGARCEYGAPIASGLPERCYGIPACGGFLLCDKRTHARDDFTPGENWAEFDGIDDCVTKIKYWLANFAAARDLAERCHHHVMTHHTYTNRAATLHNALLAWHDGKRGLLQ